MTLPGRDVADVDALVTDRYLDALLASGDLADHPSEPHAAGPSAMRFRAAAPHAAARQGIHAIPLGTVRLDAAVRLASARLTRDLPRFHPSFRFEERLAIRLAEAAAAMRLPAAAGAEGSVAVLPIHPTGLPDGFDPLANPHPDGDADAAAAGVTVPRPLLIGGAMAASALSLAGAAWVAWRRSRGGASPMARAARAAHSMRGRPA